MCYLNSNSLQTKSRLSQDFRVMLLSRAFGTVIVMNSELQKIKTRDHLESFGSQRLVNSTSGKRTFPAPHTDFLTPLTAVKTLQS